MDHIVTSTMSKTLPFISYPNTQPQQPVLPTGHSDTWKIGEHNTENGNQTTLPCPVRKTEHLYDRELPPSVFMSSNRHLSRRTLTVNVSPFFRTQPCIYVTIVLIIIPAGREFTGRLFDRDMYLFFRPGCFCLFVHKQKLVKEDTGMSLLLKIISDGILRGCSCRIAY